MRLLYGTGNQAKLETMRRALLDTAIEIVLEDSLQPGVRVRIVNTRYLDDGEMIDYYAELAQRCGGQCVAQYRNAICLILDDHTVYEHMGDDISGERFLISSVPHPKRRQGFPLDSLSVHIATGRYYLDMGESRVSTTYEGFRAFFERVLPAGAKLPDAATPASHRGTP